MLSKQKIKLIHSLAHKKRRDALGLFVAEGPKVVPDIMAYAAPVLLVATEAWLAGHGADTSQATETVEVTDDELRGISFLQHPQQVLALFRCQDLRPGEAAEIDGGQLYMALDGVQDPGNLGTIIRLCDWFGITRLFCSPVTADVWNPKVVQATMGSVARVRVDYCELTALLDTLPAGFPVYGTLLDGDDIRHAPLENRGLLVMGNEASGLSPEVRQRVTQRLLIPPYPAGRSTADSLNVAIASALAAYALRSAGTRG